MLYIYVLKSLLSARGIATLRKDYPCLFPAILLILGQLVAIQFSPVYASLLGVTLALMFLLLKRRGFFYVLILIYLSGIASTIFHSHKSSGLPDAQISYLAFVDEEPRFNRPGQARLSLLLVARVERATDGLRIWKLKKSHRTLCRTVHLPWRNIHSAKNGSFFIVRAQFRELVPNSNPFTYANRLIRRSYSSTCRISYASKTIASKDGMVVRARQSLMRNLQEVLGTGERSGLILSMAFGKKDSLSVRTERAFKDAGLAHLMVVSGYHVSLVFGLAFLFFNYSLALSRNIFLIVPIRHLASVIALMVTIFYVAIVGVGGSSLRAATAILVFVIARLWERDSSIFSALTVSGIVISSLWPGAFFELGIQLTYAALLGICLALSRSAGSTIWTYLSICFWASYTTSFIVLIWFDYISLVGFINNPLYAPVLAFFACKVGIVSVVAYVAGIDVNGYLLQGTGFVLLYLRDLIIYTANLPLASVSLKGAEKYVVVVLMTFFCLRATFIELKKYCLQRNIWAG